MRLQELFVETLSVPAFEVVARENYRNRFGRPGVRWHGTLNGHLVFVSESVTTVPSAPAALARIPSGGKAHLDRTKKDVYLRRKESAQTGIADSWTPDPHMRRNKAITVRVVYPSE